MAEPERTTSYAKSVKGLHYEENALDRARALRDQFVKAQEQNNEKQKPREAEKPREGDKAGSQMVKDDRPVLQPTPRGPMRQAPDRFAAYRKLEREHKKAGMHEQAKANAPEKPAHDRFADAAKEPAKHHDVDKVAEARKRMEMLQNRQQDLNRQQERDRER